METKFDNKWNIWYHNSKEDWTIKGYEKLFEINNIKNYWKLYNNWDRLGGINNKHFFIMKNDITPIWEDPNNKDGGCWSFKVNDNLAQDLWNDLSIQLVTENLSSVKDDIVGLSACLKKNNFSRIPVIVGGIIPPSDERKLKSFGVKEVFTPKDFKIEEIMKQITQIIKEAY